MGTGLTANATGFPITDAVLRSVIERASRFIDLECGVEPEHFESALYPVWKSSTVYIVGDIVTPTTPNNHVYRVTDDGTSGSSEPTWPTGSGQTVTNGGVVFTEYGADVIATEKTVYGDGTNLLKIPAYVPGSLDEDISVPDGYTLPTFIERDGYLVLSSNGSLTHRISPFPSFWRGGGWYDGVPITLTAKWGYESTPADIKLATIELTINLLRETDPAAIKLIGAENIPLRETLPPRVKEICKKYRARQGVFV